MNVRIWKCVVILGLILNTTVVWAQKDKSDTFNPDSVDSKEIADPGLDSLDWARGVQLETTKVYGLVLNSDLEKKYYVWLRRRVRDVWPYVKRAVEEYNFVTDSAQQISSNRQRRKFIKERKKVLADELEDKLKNLSASRGQVLVKLIHRQTDKTAYDMIKELRGGFNAFLWNSLGGAFDIDLKKEFNPEKTREDLYLEVIIRRELAAGRLEPIED